ncbi:hypothetical protein ACHAXT_000621 [Thalassiosira profunda]
MPVDPDDEFFGDQASDPGDFSVEECSSGSNQTSDALSNHEYRSSEANVRTLSYLDGYDETKEEQLQDGFADGYRQSFQDAMAVGRQLGSMCAGLALKESSTLGLPPRKSDVAAKTDEGSSNAIERPASMVRQFLTEKILAEGGGSKEDAEKEYGEALLRLINQLEKMST